MRNSGRRATRRAERRSTWGRALLGKVTGRGRVAVTDLTEEISERSQRMLDRSVVGRRGTRRRALMPMVLGLLTLGGMFQLVSANVLAVNFNTTSSSFRLYSNYLDAQKAGAFLAPSTKASGSQVGLADLGIVTAKLDGLCAIVQEDIGSLGTFSLVLTAGSEIPDSYDNTVLSPVGTGSTIDSSTGKLSGSGLITANNLFINSPALGGYGNLISGLNLGESADNVWGETVGTPGSPTWPNANKGNIPTSGNFGLYADNLNVSGLAGDTYGLNLAGNITLPQLSLKIVPGAKAQADCA
ncbi:DUF6230 family protein [Nocardioides sp.]|uniref:DUF6230 family protein n=1 Tax=Nocardioides sp. TaxID=35761 RepID=UPI0039E6D012